MDGVAHRFETCHWIKLKCAVHGHKVRDSAGADKALSQLKAHAPNDPLLARTTALEAAFDAAAAAA